MFHFFQRQANSYEDVKEILRKRGFLGSNAKITDVKPSGFQNKDVAMANVSWRLK